MGQDPFSFDLQLSAGQTGSTDPTRYIAPPFDARLVSTHEAMLLAGHDRAILKLPVSSVRLLGLCDRFRTLDEHARHASAALQIPPEQIPEMRQALQQMADREVLRTEHAVWQMLTDAQDRQEPDAGIETLFVRTCARPDTLGRLLESVGALENTGSLKQCLVLDDDSDAASAARTANLVQQYRNKLPIDLVYVSHEHRGHLLASIAAAAGVDPAALAWCIEGSDDDDQPGYGASFNLALLLGAGKRIALIDDDAALTAYELNGCSYAVRFSPLHTARMAFPEPDRPLIDQFQRLPGNPIGRHARYLGASGGDLVRASEGDVSDMFSQVDPQLLFELADSPKVKITSNGTLGDPGTAGIQWLLSEPAENLQPLCESESRYRALLDQRQVARSADCVQATTAFSLMTTTLSGIDNRELLLPTQARAANEDLLFGALVSYLYPGSLHVTLPHMLLHLRPQPRHWHSKDFQRARTTNQGRFLATQIERLANRVPAIDSNSRLQVLKGWMSNLAALGPTELGWRLRQDLVELRGETIEQIAASRRDLKPPPWLAADFDRALTAHADISDSTRQKLDRLAGRLPAFARQYAASMDSWCRAWRYCSQTDPIALVEVVRQDAEA